MPRTTKTETIDGITYEISQLGGVDASRALLPAMRIAPALVEAASCVAGGKFGRAAAAMQAVREEDLQALIAYFETTTVVVTPMLGATHGQTMRLPLKGAFDDHFAGRVPSMIRWIRFCYELNFSDFLADMMPSAPSEKTTADPSNPPS